MVRKELEKARAELASPAATKLQERVNTLKAELRNKKSTPEYIQTVRGLRKTEEQLAEAAGELQLAKSAADEAYYEYQHAFEAGRGYANKKKEWERLHAAANGLAPKVQQLTANKEAFEAKLYGYERELREAEAELGKLRRDAARLEERLAVLGRKSPEIRQVVITDYERNGFKEPILKVDRCLSCHMAADRKGFEGVSAPFKTHPQYELFIGKHSPELIACTACHDGQGTGLSFYDAGHSPKDKNQAERWRREHGWKPIAFWETPMLPGDFAQASCKRCHPLEEDIEGAKVLSKGINLFRETLGCVNCHLAKGYEDVNKIGPDLSLIGTKANPAWLFRWIKDPKAHHQKSRMPNFLFSDREAAATTAYLTGLGGDARWAVHEFREGLLGAPELIAKGRELVRDVGCTGCHTVGETEVYKDSKRDMAPVLTDIGNKTTPAWIFNWILDPAVYLKNPLMPDLRLSREEAEAIVVYLVSLKKTPPEPPPGLEAKVVDPKERELGRRIIADYGCYGCHDIPGTEKRGRVGAELSNYGAKDVAEIAFGHARHVERSWLGFTKAKLKTPRVFQTEVVVQRMPDFALSEDENHALSVLLKAFRDETIPKEFTKAVSPAYTDIQQGRKLIKKYNCIGCHEVEKDWGSENILISLLEQHAEMEAVGHAPPPLIGEGRKVQSQWLFSFINNPTSIRPWLEVRMPTFYLNDQQVDSMIRYFQSVSGENVRYHFWKMRKTTAEEKQEMQALFKTLQCLKCHEFGKPAATTVAAAELAPSLALTKVRLKPKWVEDWLRNPQALEPGTKMPNFFLDVDEEGEVTELLPEPEKKIRLLVDYLYGTD
ncbi:MAG: c-type cytochrome [Deltaproteobacteria bacterium]|nr:c-type cytochrome [Deltaproteobacteria bacterium]